MTVSHGNTTRFFVLINSDKGSPVLIGHHAWTEVVIDDAVTDFKVVLRDKEANATVRTRETVGVGFSRLVGTLMASGRALRAGESVSVIVSIPGEIHGTHTCYRFEGEIISLEPFRIVGNKLRDEFTGQEAEEFCALLNRAPPMELHPKSSVRVEEQFGVRVTTGDHGNAIASCRLCASAGPGDRILSIDSEPLECGCGPNHMKAMRGDEEVAAFCVNTTRGIGLAHQRDSEGKFVFENTDAGRLLATEVIDGVRLVCKHGEVK
jgi:hypothetical protein